MNPSLLLEEQEGGLKAESKKDLLERLFLSLPYLQGAHGLLWYYYFTYLLAVNGYILGK